MKKHVMFGIAAGVLLVYMGFGLGEYVYHRPMDDRYQEGYSKGVLDEEKSTLQYCNEQKRDCDWLEARAFGVDVDGTYHGDGPD